MGDLCRERRRYNSSKHRRHRSCWRNPFLVFFVSFAALGSLRFRVTVRTKNAATKLLRQHQQNKLNHHNSERLISPVAESVLPVVALIPKPVDLQKPPKMQMQKLKLNNLQLRSRQKHKRQQQQGQPMIRYILKEKGTTEGGLAFERYKAVYADPKIASLPSSLASSSKAQQQEQKSLQAVTVQEWVETLAHNAAVTAPELSAVLRQCPFAAFFLETKGVSADTAAQTTFEFVLVDAPRLAIYSNKADRAAFSNQFESQTCATQSATGCRFHNLSGDAILVAPKPLVDLSSLPSSSILSATTASLASASAGSAADTNTNIDNSIDSQQLLLPYAHLANFVRQAPTHQVTGLWQMAASAYLEALQPSKNSNEDGSISSTGRRKINIKKQKTSSGAAKPVWFSTSGMGVAWLHFRLDQRPKYYTYRAFAEEI
jgi:hypothetical protein